jgi:tetratricopeptide (TPR) repeat protein/tRNA A-37 threonylcarbamoyl transferase component Bud32
MSTPPSADRNLIFGLLALQMDFVTREQLLEAMHAWMLAKHLPLGDILHQRGVLAEDERQVLDLAMQKHIQRHGGDPQASLAALRVEPAVRSQLQGMDDADVQHSLAALSVAPAGSATTAPVIVPAGDVRYRRLREHAKGGLGEVFVALDEELRREVALKEIQERFADQPDSRARFLREAEVTGNLEHPGVVPVYGLGAYADGRPFYAMRLIRGQSMQEAISRFHEGDEDPRRDPGERGLALRDLLTRFVAVCNAVFYAHAQGVIHRDLKPANVMLGEYGETLVIDWGLARLLEQLDGEQTTAERQVLPGAVSGSMPTQMGQVVGTPAYMPPEQANGRLDQMERHSDVFSLGATLYALLTGQAPYSGPDMLAQAVRAEVVPARRVKRSVSVALEAVCGKAMAVKPEERYPSARALAEDVQRWLADEPVSAYCEPWSVRAGRWLRRHKTLAASTAAVLLASLVIGGFAVWRLEQQAAQQRRGVEAALAEVARLQQQARWAEAGVALDGAESRLEKGGPKDLRARLEQARRDIDLVARLDAIRLKLATWTEGGFDFATADRSYEETFRDTGMGEVGGDTTAAAGWVRTSAVRDALVAALDHWVTCTGKRERRNWLLEVARRADPDPWRDRARDPVIQEDRKALARLMVEKAIAKQSPQLLIALAALLPAADAERLRRRTQEWHPGDFWINFLVGDALAEGKKPGEAVGYYRAALALRPKTFAVHINLGMALYTRGQLEEAIVSFRQAIALDPRSGMAHNNLTMALLARGKVDEAIAVCRQAIALDPKDASAHSNLGNALHTMGRLDEAIAEHRKAIALDPGYAKPHNNLGTALRARGRLDEAIAAHRKAIALDATSALAHSNLGLALHDQGKVDEAIARYHKAIALDPGHAMTHASLGQALSTKGRLDEAVACCRKAIQLDPKLSLPHIELGTVLVKQGKREEAIACYRQAIVLAPRHAVAHINLGKALHTMGRLDEAIVAYRNALEIDPGSADTHNNLGSILHARGRLDEALAELRQAVRIDSESAQAHYNLGVVLSAKGKTEEAIAAYRKAIKLDPRNADAHDHLGFILWVKGKRDEALGEYRQAIAGDPRHVKAHYELAYALGASGKVDEAIAVYHKVIALDPRYPTAHTNLGTLLYQQGKVDEAIAAFRQAIALDPKNATNHYNLGNGLRARGKTEDAITAYRQALEINPKYPEAHCNLAQCLHSQGRFTEALGSLRRGHALGVKRPGWRYPSALWVRQAERMVALEEKLPALRKGEYKPRDNKERIALVEVCRAKRLYHAAATLYADAFAAQPRLEDDLQAGHRYNAACAAALAGCGQGKDSPRPDDKERARLRGQALTGLRADLALWTKQASGTRALRRAVGKGLRHWQKNPDLAGVRDDEALERLPEDEQAEWKKLWAEVAALLKKSEEP